MIRLLQKQHRFRAFFLFFLAFILIISCSFPVINAQEESKPKAKDWQLNGILAALDDPYLEVKLVALAKVTGYDWQNESSETLEKIAKKAADILKDEKVDDNFRGSAAIALGNLGDAATPYVDDIANLLQDKAINSRVQGVAAQALCNLGGTVTDHVDDILNFLQDEQISLDTRRDTASALVNLGNAVASHVNDLSHILKDEQINPVVRSHVAVALGNLGDATVPYIHDLAEYLANILKNEKDDWHIRENAVEALGNLGDAAVPYTQYIFDFLKEENFYAPIISNNSAAGALGSLGEAAKPYLQELVNILKDEQVARFVRRSAAEALGNLGDTASDYVDDLADILKDEQMDPFARRSAAEALGNLGDAGGDYVDYLADILKDKQVHPSFRVSAAKALGNLGDAGGDYVDDLANILANILKDEQVDSFVRDDVIWALGNTGKAAQPYIKDIIDILKDENVSFSIDRNAASALEKIIGKLELENLVAVLNNVYYAYYISYFPQWRFQSYFLGGGTEEVKTLLTWLGNKDSKGIPEKLKIEEGRKILELFDRAWQYSEGVRLLRADLAEKIAYVAKNTPWQPWQIKDMQLLKRHYDNLKNTQPGNAFVVQSAITRFKYLQWLFSSILTVFLHIFLWLALIFAYPTFPCIQAIFFWNPRVRKIIGVGYVDFFLAWIPFLRRKLFEPFQISLLADAELNEFSAPAYFPNSCVKKKPGESQPLTQAIPAIKGQIVLEGNSGLGKSMFLRHLLHTSRRIVVYLPARKCDKGVIAAIQAKLHGQAKDEAFLKNLIYSGAIDICIDGLNEVTADTRAQIRQFVESYFRGNIIMTTQPLEWEPPATATTYYLQPLAKEQIQEFLLSRQGDLSPDATIQGDTYCDACINYLEKILDDSQSPEELTAAQNILSNPMDLTVVSQMLSHNKQPELFRLIEQQYNLMAEEYEDNWNQPFPLKTFSEAVYKMRLKDESILPTEKFYNELIAMEDEKYKMVVSRQWQDNKGKSKQQWCFRHDKIMDFFLVQTFLGDSEEVQSKLIDHMGDPRFRGVYFLLANLLSPEDALSLREELIQYAADTRDHTVSDTFVTLLRTRPQLQ